jgi:hypothetical protein
MIRDTPELVRAPELVGGTHPAVYSAAYAGRWGEKQPSFYFDPRVREQLESKEPRKATFCPPSSPDASLQAMTSVAGAF